MVVRKMEKWESGMLLLSKRFDRFWDSTYLWLVDLTQKQIIKDIYQMV